MTEHVVEFWNCGERWHAQVGEAFTEGGREECLQWMVERLVECEELARLIKSRIQIEKWQEIPYAFAPGE